MSAMFLPGNAGTGAFSCDAGSRVLQVKNTPSGFVLNTAEHTYCAKNLVIAAGGASYPNTGSTGDGCRLTASLGHTIQEIGPALTPLLIKNFPFADLAGMSFAGLPFSVWREKRKIVDGQGDVLFTHTGLLRTRDPRLFSRYPGR